MVFWHCHKVGHLWGECNTKLEGWMPSGDDRAKAEALREEMKRRRLQSQKDKAAHGACGAAQSEYPSEAHYSGAL